MAVLFVSDLNSVQKQKLTDAMRPGKLSSSGFLNETEDLLECTRKKSEALALCGVSHATLASRLVNVAHGYQPVPGVSVSKYTYKRAHACPFEELDLRCSSGAQTWVFRNEQTGDSMTVPSIMPHLLRDHHFFEGNVKFGLDPTLAVKLLQIPPSHADIHLTAKPVENEPQKPTSSLSKYKVADIVFDKFDSSHPS